MTEYNCGYPRESAVVPIVTMGLLSLVVFGLLVYFLVNMRSRDPKSKQLDNAAKITRLGAVVTSFYFASVSLFFISGIIDYYDCGHAYTRSVGYAFHFTGYNLLLVLFFYRFIKTFENSPYAISPKIISLTKMIVFVPFIIVFFLSTSTYFSLFSLALISVFGLLYLTTTLGASIVILIVFVKKLNVVIKDFVKQFGTISAPQLTKLNQSLR